MKSFSNNEKNLSRKKFTNFLIQKPHLQYLGIEIQNWIAHIQILTWIFTRYVILLSNAIILHLSFCLGAIEIIMSSSSQHALGVKRTTDQTDVSRGSHLTINIPIDSVRAMVSLANTYLNLLSILKQHKEHLKRHAQPWLVWFSWLQHSSVHQKVSGSTPGQGTYPGLGRQPIYACLSHQCLFLSPKINLKQIF